MKITADKRNEVKNLLMNGFRGYEIAEKTGISEASVTKIRKELQDDGFQIWHTHGGRVSSRY